MATTAVGIGNITNTLQTVLMPFIRDNFPKKTLLLDKVKRNSNTTFMNNQFSSPIRTSRHGGVTNLATDKAKLNTGSANTDRATVGTKIITGTFDISDLAIKASRDSRGAVESALVFQAETLSDDYARNINRQLFGDGSEIIGMVNSSANASAVVVSEPSASIDDGRAKDRFGSINGDIVPTKYFQPGQIIGVGTAAAAVGTIATVFPRATGGAGTAGTITFTAGIAHAANDSLFLLDGDGTGAGTSGIEGLGVALDDTTGTSLYAAVPRSTFAWAPQRSTANEALTLADMEDQYLAANEFSMIDDTYAIFMNKSLYRKYGDILTAMRRTVNETELISGWTGLQFSVGAGKVGIFLDYQVPDGEVLIVNLDTLTITQVDDVDWLEGANKTNLDRRTDFITFQATMVWFVNMLCLAPAANAKLVQKTK